MKVLITGASRGIGFEMVKQSMERGWDVHACCRHPQKAEKLLSLAKLANGRVSVHVVDLEEPATIQALAYELKHESIDILISNAGVYGSDKHQFGQVDAQDWLQTFAINTIAPLKLCEAFVEMVALSELKIIACLSSKMGSMADNTSGGSYIYRSSKASLNAVVKSMSHDLRTRGIRCVALHPGWVKTDMGGPHAEISATESVERMFDILLGLEDIDSGRFIDIDGADIPW